MSLIESPVVEAALVRLLGVFVLVYVAGFVAFVATLPRAVPAAARADGIVALTGDDARLRAAVGLLEHGAAKRLLVTGVNGGTTREEVKRIGHGGVRFDCCADLGYAAEDTHGNALEAAEWSRHHGYRSLIVVTANYHMPRSLTEFSAAMPGTKLIAYPVAPQPAEPPSLWASAGMLHLLHGEYAKYLASLLMTRWESPEPATALDHEPDGGKARIAS